MRALLALVLAGCLSPAMRPARAVEGLSATIASGATVGAADEQFCYEDCEARDVWSVTAANGDGRYGRMLAPDLGLSLGASLAGHAVSKTEGMIGLLALYGQLSLQSERAALAAGVDAAANMIGGSLSADWRPMGEARWSPTLTGYTRYLHAIRGPADPMDEDAAEIDSAEVGFNLRWGLLMAQYSYYARESGRLSIPTGIEGSADASAWHVVLIGLELNRLTAPGLRP